MPGVLGKLGSDLGLSTRCTQWYSGIGVLYHVTVM